MLTEYFIASVGLPTSTPKTNLAKDAAIFIYESQPIATQRAVFKKSATAPNCLATNSSHIFAAQATRAVVHVYNREKGNQEAVVPFSERITCLTFACDDSVLVLGTAEGRFFLWETCTGRLITTAPSHLQAVKVLEVDPTSNFLLSASCDSTVHVWSLSALLSFSNAGSQALSPLSTFISHRSDVTALAIGHAASFCNIAVSASKDRTCLVWDYHTNSVLRTYLLPAVPACVELSAADRTAYVGFEDGSVLLLDLFTANGDAVQNGVDATTPIQPPTSSWLTAPENAYGAVLSLSVSFDGTTLLTGHDSGAILSWDLARKAYQGSALTAPLPGPVTDLQFLPVMGYPNATVAKVRTPVIVKPKLGAFDDANGLVPASYALHVEITGKSSPSYTGLAHELTHATFPDALLDEGLSELAAWNHVGPLNGSRQAENETSDFIELDVDDAPAQSRRLTLEEQNAALKQQLAALRRLQGASLDRLQRVDAERKALLLKEKQRLMNGSFVQKGVADAEVSMAEDDFSDEDDDDEIVGIVDTASIEDVEY